LGLPFNFIFFAGSVYTKFFYSNNVSIKYYKPLNISQFDNLVKTKCRPSFEIHEHAKEVNLNFKAKHRDYAYIVKSMKLRANITRPFTQVVFAPRNTLGLISSKMRYAVPYYGHALNYLKHNIFN